MNYISKIDNKKLDQAIIVWFRQDLRVEDNPALLAAVETKLPIIPLYIVPITEATWAPGAASRVWLHLSLLAFQNELKELHSRLIVREGEIFSQLINIMKGSGARSIVWNRCYEPQTIARDIKIKDNLKKEGFEVKTFNGSLLNEPWQIKQKNDKPYQVFTPFWQACLKRGDVEMPSKAPHQLLSPKTWPKSLAVEELNLLPKINWANEIMEFWPAGTKPAQVKFKKFIHNMGQYNLGRDRPDLDNVSYLSPYLHLGQLSPRQIVYAIQGAMQKNKQKDFVAGAQTYLKEIFWREFAYHLLFYFPYTTDKPLKEQYNKFPWHSNKVRLQAWQQGKTGYPIVDAGMRQLWQIGWMHNRVRMIVASFLVKDLLIPWQLGAKWFWDTLIDADLANNTLGWQWSAGCGADAAPYFRVFNPISQGKKYDPEGEYVKRFIPELKNLPIEYIHSPWLAGENVLRAAKVVLGKDYPKPIVDHNQARLNALAAWRQIK